MTSEGESKEPSVQRATSETLCKNLSQGIHAAAQPLAILRASFGNPYIDRMSAEELRELAASAALEIERVCGLFSCLQQLVSAESIEPSLSATPTLPLLAYVVDGVKLVFDDDGMFLRSIVPNTCPPVLINRTRTLQALTSVLLIAHAISRPQDTVELITSCPSTNTVRIVARNMNAHVDALNAAQSLNMALAESNIRSQQGGFIWSQQPFNVQIELQRAQPEH
jgi:hypothetical protein